MTAGARLVFDPGRIDVTVDCALGAPARRGARAEHAERAGGLRRERSRHLGRARAAPAERVGPSREHELEPGRIELPRRDQHVLVAELRRRREHDARWTGRPRVHDEARVAIRALGAPGHAAVDDAWLVSFLRRCQEQLKPTALVAAERRPDEPPILPQIDLLDRGLVCAAAERRRGPQLLPGARLAGSTLGADASEDAVGVGDDGQHPVAALDHDRRLLRGRGRREERARREASQNRGDPAFPFHPLARKRAIPDPAAAPAGCPSNSPSPPPASSPRRASCGAGSPAAGGLGRPP